MKKFEFMKDTIKRETDKSYLIAPKGKGIAFWFPKNHYAAKVEDMGQYVVLHVPKGFRFNLHNVKKRDRLMSVEDMSIVLGV